MPALFKKTMAKKTSALVSRVGTPPPPPPPPMVSSPPPPNGKARNPRKGRTFFCLKNANSHRDGPPEPGILVSVVTFEAMQLRGVSKVATLTWIGHGFGPQP